SPSPSLPRSTSCSKRSCCLGRTSGEALVRRASQRGLLRHQRDRLPCSREWSGPAVNPIERVIRGIDARQQRFGPAALIFGVMKKFGDDNPGILVSNFAYSAFVCVFPLLLVLVTILNIVVARHPALQRSL